MLSPARAIKDRFFKFASELRFPTLLALTVGLFVLDFFLPDPIFLADEIFLGLLAVVLARWKKTRRERRTAAAMNLPASTVVPKM